MRKAIFNEERWTGIIARLNDDELTTLEGIIEHDKAQRKLVESQSAIQTTLAGLVAAGMSVEDILNRLNSK